jgi:ribosomal protein L31
MRWITQFRGTPYLRNKAGQILFTQTNADRKKDKIKEKIGPKINVEKNSHPFYSTSQKYQEVRESGIF